MAGTDREAPAVSGADGSTVLLSTGTTTDPRAHVSVSVYLLCNPPRNLVSLLRRVSASLWECIRLLTVADRMQLPGPAGGNSVCHRDGPSMATNLCSTGTQT